MVTDSSPSCEPSCVAGAVESVSKPNSSHFSSAVPVTLLLRTRTAGSASRLSRLRIFSFTDSHAPSHHPVFVAASSCIIHDASTLTYIHLITACIRISPHSLVPYILTHSTFPRYNCCPTLLWLYAACALALTADAAPRSLPCSIALSTDGLVNYADRVNHVDRYTLKKIYITAHYL